MMTRKHFQALANAINDAIQMCANKEQEKGVASAALAVAVKLAKENPRFDTRRFLEACGVQA